MMKITFDVPGKPVPKQSYKHSKSGGYTPAHVKQWQNIISDAAAWSFLTFQVPRFDGDVKVKLEFRLHDARRRDSDNLSKCVLDGMNGIAWIDDTQVNDLHITKVIDRENPGVMITVEG
jgi:crossover junction endodeoxyribonuclease RusA